MSQHKTFFCSHCVVTIFCYVLFILCRDIKFLCRNKYFCIQLFNFVATYFATLQHSFCGYSQSLLLAELFVATLKSLSRQTCLNLSHCSSVFYRDIILLCCDRNLLLCSFLCCDINLIVETKLYCHLFDHYRDRANNIATFFFNNFSIIVATQKSIVTTKFCLLIAILLQHSFLCHNIYHSIFLILCRDKVVKCRDRAHF